MADVTANIDTALASSCGYNYVVQIYSQYKNVLYVLTKMSSSFHQQKQVRGNDDNKYAG